MSKGVHWTEKFVLSSEEKQYLLDTYMTDEFCVDNRNYYSGYHHSNGAHGKTSTKPNTWVDERLRSIYIPYISGVMQEQGLLACKKDCKDMMIFSHQLWAQIYTKEKKSDLAPHHHYATAQTVISWIHFVDVPDDQDCLYFQFGDRNAKNKFADPKEYRHYPQPQKTDDIIFYSPWIWHGVDTPTSDKPRVVVAGNVLRLK